MEKPKAGISNYLKTMQINMKRKFSYKAQKVNVIFLKKN